MIKDEYAVGRRFGRWTVIECDSLTPQRYKGHYWICRCDCGSYASVYASSLIKGKSLSCGCLRKEQTAERFSTHKKSKSKLHRLWSIMKQRCYYLGRDNYKYYGGRGIAVCDEWKDDFQAFYDWAMANGYREGLTIDRKDVDGNYCPENCRWITQKEQASNKSNVRQITYNGETHTIPEWAEITGMNYSALYRRLTSLGWAAEDALAKPINNK